VRNQAGALQRSPFRVVDDLNREWRELLERDGSALPPWAGPHAGQTGCSGLVALVAAASRGDDEVLRPLLVESRRGDNLAARTVLQAMLGRLVQMARRDSRSDVDDYVAAMWCVIARYPLAARPVRIAANLALDTLKMVQRDRDGTGRGQAAVLMSGPVLESLFEQGARLAGLDRAAELHALGAADVIEAGHRLRLIDDSTGRLLRHVYVDGLSGREAAARSGTSAGSLRVRCSRAVSRLAAHAAELVEAA
jgi:DNA-directed RNA polymerase specialized sigma24 family protein